VCSHFFQHRSALRSGSTLDEALAEERPRARPLDDAPRCARVDHCTKPDGSAAKAFDTVVSFINMVTLEVEA
jgi:hypothetical protein